MLQPKVRGVTPVRRALIAGGFSVRGLAELFQEDAPDLLDGEGVALARMSRADDELRLHPLQVGARVLHHAVVSLRRVPVPLHRDDGVRIHPFCHGDLGKGEQQGVLRRHAVDARGHLVPQSQWQLRLLLHREKLGGGPDDVTGQSYDLADQGLNPPRGAKAAPVGCGDEHHTAHEGKGLEKEIPPDLPFYLGLGAQILDGDRIPGRSTRMRRENSGSSAAAFALSLISLRRRGSSNGMLVSILPRSSASPLARIRQSQGLAA
jgi:hypothetical protein